MHQPPRISAASEAEVIAALQAQLAAAEFARLDQLESRKQIREAAYEVPAPAPSAAASWVDRIKMKGDFRYRHEFIDAEFASKNRNRQRIRARPAIEAAVSDSVKVGFGLATGGDNPTGANQTLGESFSSKPINMDLAYFNWSPEVEGLNVLGGKFKNPLHRTGGNGLLWDSDLRPEGIAGTFKRAGFSATVLGLWLDESSSSKDKLVLGGQLDYQAKLGEAARLLVGAGYYDLSGVKGQEVPIDGDPLGNSVDLANRYIYGYKDLELFGEFDFNIGDRPARIFANYVKNLDAGEFDTGWVLGGAMDFMHGTRSWRLAYAYQDLEADAVFALLTDSDFSGGGTDAKGHIFRGSYNLTRSISLGGTLFLNQRGGNLGPEEDYNRLMLDVEFKY